MQATHITNATVQQHFATRSDRESCIKHGEQIESIMFLVVYLNEGPSLPAN